jgi:hypothetical protein
MLLEDKNVVIYGAEHRRRGWTKPENRDKYERLLKPRSQDDRAHPRRECNEPRKERTEGDNRMRQAGTHTETGTRRKESSGE